MKEKLAAMIDGWDSALGRFHNSLKTLDAKLSEPEIQGETSGWRDLYYSIIAQLRLQGKYIRRGLSSYSSYMRDLYEDLQTINMLLDEEISKGRKPQRKY